MSAKKRRMATVNQRPKNVNPKKWFRIASAVFFVLSLVTSAIIYAPEIQQWWQKSESAKNNTVDNTRNVSDGWNVAFTQDVDFISAQDMEKYIKSKLDDSFFMLDVEKASGIVLQHPWVKEVKARKVWPSTLMLQIEEHQPWLNLNNQQLISVEGVIFTPENAKSFKSLPLLRGKFGNTEDLLSMYQFFAQQMPDNEFRIVELSYNAHNGWTMLLANEIQLYLGNKDLNERLERFALVLEEMKSNKKTKVAYIDLRYQSGVAVGWRKSIAAEEQSGQVAHY